MKLSKLISVAALMSLTSAAALPALEKTGGGELHCLGPIAEVALRPACQILTHPDIERSTDLVERGSCTPGTYRCNGLSPYWVVCDGSGEWQIGGSCGSAFCVMTNGSPYCIAHRSIERQVPATTAAEPQAACAGPVAALAHKKECQVSKEVASKVEVSIENADGSLCTPGQYVCNGGSSLYWLICDVSGQWQTGGYCGGRLCNTINGVPFCSAKQELTTNTALQEREVPNTVDIVSRDSADCLGPVSEVAKEKKCQVDTPSRVNIASDSVDSVDRASCDPGQYLCANFSGGGPSYWLVCGINGFLYLGACAVGVAITSTESLTASEILPQDSCEAAG